MIEISFSDYSDSSDVPTIPTISTAKVPMVDADSDSYYYVSEEDTHEVGKPKAPPEPMTPSPRRGSAPGSPSRRKEEESESLSGCFILPQEYVPLSEIIPVDEPTSFIIFAQRSGKDVTMSACQEEQQIMTSSKEVKGREKFYAIRDQTGTLIGFLRKWNKGHGYSVCSPNKKERDDRDGELMGIGFHKDRMRVVATRDGKESWAVSKRRLLSSIAQTDVESNEKLIVADMDLQAMKLVDKETNKDVFSMTKNEDDSYTVERCGYVTQLEAYALAYLIVKKKLL